MDVETLLFASYRDLVGCERTTVHLAEGATVASLVAELRARGEPWSRLPADPAVAVNHRLAARDEPLHAGDEVALIPPVAGG